MAIGTLALLAGVLAGCGDDIQTVEWDLTSPLTPRDLGSKADTLIQIEGEVDLAVTFPNGRVISGQWDRGPRAAALRSADVNDRPPIDTIVFREVANDIDKLSAAIDRYRAEWGDATSPSGTLDGLLDLVERRADTNPEPIGQLFDVGENIFGFEGEPIDGLQPSISIRFTDDIATIDTTVRFEPARG